MKFIQTGSINKNFLNKIETLNPFERIENMLLDKLEYFIGFIMQERFEIANLFINNLISKYQNLAKIKLSDDSFSNVKSYYSKMNHLNQYPELFKTSICYFLKLLQMENENLRKTTEIEVSYEFLMPAWVYPFYYLLETLSEIIGRQEAIKIYKRFITNYYIDHPSPDRVKFVSLAKMFEERSSVESSDWVIVHTLLEEGKYAFKNKNCPTLADTTKDLPDVEFKYLVCCYGDFEKFRAHSNEHIILTMEHTIIQGDSYCSRVMHDTRFDYDLRHPPKEFWDNFEPGKEEISIKYYND